VRIALVILLLGLSVTALRAETAIQRRACQGDVLLLCRSYIPNRAAITRCLARHFDALSPPCRAVFDGRLK
jgi:hypothetical protein